MSDWWTNTSLEPSSGAMKPNPLVALNHLTVPTVTLMISSADRTRNRRTHQPGRTCRGHSAVTTTVPSAPPKSKIGPLALTVSRRVVSTSTQVADASPGGRYASTASSWHGQAMNDDVEPGVVNCPGSLLGQLGRGEGRLPAFRVRTSELGKWRWASGEGGGGAPYRASRLASEQGVGRVHPGSRRGLARKRRERAQVVKRVGHDGHCCRRRHRDGRKRRRANRYR